MTSGWELQEVDPGGDPALLPSSTCGVVLLTGCGLAALWSPAEGVMRLMSPGDGEEIPVPGVELEGVARVVAANAGSGGARRVLDVAGGGRLLEEVLVRDGAPGLLLRWSIPEEGGPAGSPGGETPVRAGLHLVLHVAGDGLTERIPVSRLHPVARLYQPRSPGRAPGRGSFRVQARRRSSRACLDSEPLALSAAGPAVPGELEERIAAAVRALDDASLQEDAQGGALPPFILGAEAGGLVTASGTPLVEMGLGALAAGRISLARAILRTLLGEGGGAPLPVLVLAAEWGGRTGETELLRDLRPALEAAVIQLVSQGRVSSGEPPPHGRSFPSPPLALEAFASAIEPLGDKGWTEGIRAGASRLRAGPATPGRTLPVLGSPVSPAPPASVRDEGPALLPPVEGFGHPDDPGLLSRRMLHAARFLRVVSEGLLGVRPDASWGRVGLAPGLPAGWERLQVSGIRVGDTDIHMEVTTGEWGVEFELTPSAGRIPLNLIFEPTLPLEQVGRVLLSGEVVEVDVLPGPPGRTGIRFQFPLDERKVVRVEPG